MSIHQYHTAIADTNPRTKNMNYTTNVETTVSYCVVTVASASWRNASYIYVWQTTPEPDDALRDGNGGNPQTNETKTPRLKRVRFADDIATEAELPDIVVHS